MVRSGKRCSAVVRMAGAFLWLLLSAGQALSTDDSHGGRVQPPLRSPSHKRNLIFVKLYCIFIMFVSTFVAGISPFFLRWNHSFLVLGIQFAGGIFMATALLHFLADANLGFQDLTDDNYPYAYMLAVCGYLLTMAGEVLVHHVQNRTEQREEAIESGGKPDSLEGNGQINGTGVVSHVGDRESDGSKLEVAAFHSDPSEEKSSCERSESSLRTKASIADAILLVLALYFHSVFEGLAIGVAGTPRDAWRTLWTVSIHKVLAAVSMAIALLRIIPGRTFGSCATYAFGFAASSPVGIGIGMIIDSFTEGVGANWTYTLTMGIASGVFMFVALNHLINKGYVPPEKLSIDRPSIRLSAVVAGAALIFTAMYFD